MVQIPQHAHCQICGKAITANKKICSDGCQGDMDALNKKRRRYALMFYAAAGMFILMLLLNLTGLFGT